MNAIKDTYFNNLVSKAIKLLPKSNGALDKYFLVTRLSCSSTDAGMILSELERRKFIKPTTNDDQYEVIVN